MVKVAVYNTSGKKIGQTELPRPLFSGKVNPDLMAQAVRVFLSNQRTSLAHAKGRSELTSRSTAKIWRQKGTGRARHGSRRSPIFVGGGKAHGPTGQERYTLKLSKKMKRAAFVSSLSAKLKENEIWIINDLSKIGRKTRAGLDVLEAVLKDKVKTKIGLIISKKNKDVALSFRNLKRLKIYSPQELNAYEVLKTDNLVFTKESLGELGEYFTAEKKAKGG